MKAYFLHPDQLLHASLPMTALDWNSLLSCEPHNLCCELTIQFNYLAELHLQNFRNEDAADAEAVNLQNVKKMHGHVHESALFALALELDRGPDDKFQLVAWTATSGVLWTQNAHGSFIVRDGMVEDGNRFCDSTAIIFGGVSSLSNEAIWNSLHD